MLDEEKRKDVISLTRLYKKMIWGDLEVREEIEKRGVPVSRGGFYSALPTLNEIENAWEYRSVEPPYDVEGVYNLQTCASFIEQQITPASEKFDPPKDPAEDYFGFYWENKSYSYSDAMAYYGLINHARPRTVVEIGAGMSTSVALTAKEQNNLDFDLVVIEPFPNDHLLSLEQHITLNKQKVQDSDSAEIAGSLKANDILFIDSTHTVKIGSDVIWILFKLLPLLEKGVYVHFHDVYLPYARPKNRLYKHQCWWEDMLLNAYLINNPHCEVKYAIHFLFMQKHRILESLLRGRYKCGGASLVFQTR